MPGYKLAFLWEVRLSDGSVIRQTPENVSILNPEILILPLVGEEPIDRVHPDDAPPELLAAVAQEQPYVEWKGEKCHWHRPSQWHDVEVTSKIIPVAEIRLFSVDDPNLFAGIWLDHTEHVGGLQYGDIYLVYEPTRYPAVIPFSLPEVAWPLDDDGNRRLPELLPVCNRDVVQDFHDGAIVGVIRSVEYRIGWKTKVDEQEYTHSIKLNAPVQGK